MKKTIYPAYVPVHFYSKSIDGQGLFYKLEDMLIFYTMLSCAARSHKLEVMSFCLMFNHFHLLIRVKDCSQTLKVIAEFKREFTRQYNLRYNRNGRLFMAPTGLAAKDTMKKLRSCIIYICNNPVTGSLCKNASAYRWNLLAFKMNGNPFSEPVRKRLCRKKFRESIDLVNRQYSCGKPLNYILTENIFKGLDRKESQQLTDYIIDKYNFLDYNSFLSCFRDWESAIAVIESTQGSEYDLREDYEDYSLYEKMQEIMKQLGYDVDCKTIDNLSDNDIKRCTMKIYGILNSPRRQVLKFLHLIRKHKEFQDKANTRGAQRHSNQ